MSETITIVAIAKDEGRYIIEWLAYHLALGVDKIIIFCNDSTDDMVGKLTRLAQGDNRIEWVFWPSVSKSSPQVTAYNEAVKMVGTKWMAFIDIDEFIVPLEANSIPIWLATIPDDVASVHVNWRGFGSGGVQDSNYEFVTRTFMRCSVKEWGNNRHFKTVARTEKVTSVLIHDIQTSGGRRVTSDFKDLNALDVGRSDRIVYSGIQINHYQSKTFSEFEARMRRGNANYPPDHPRHGRDDSFDRFGKIDVNAETNDAIRRFDAIVDAERAKLLALL